ncbi:MAG: response regulator transcription factor [Terriglobia bacterium]
MRILIGEDDPVTRRVLEIYLTRWGYEVVVACDGTQAWENLQRPDPPRILILDWMMPGVSGVELCKRVRQSPSLVPSYLIILTARSDADDVVLGLDSGADDYVTKPFNREELRARVKGAERVVALQQKLAERVQDLEAALGKVKQLQGLLPICSYCKKIRDDKNYWQQVEQYISKHSEIQFSHGICPDCYEVHVKPSLGGLPATGERKK